MTYRTLLDESSVHPAVRDKIANYRSEILDEATTAVANHDVVVIGMAVNPFVKKARKLLKQRGVPFEYIGHGGYLSDWRLRLAYKMWTGWWTFPMVFVKGTFIGGHKELEALASSGELDTMLKS